jgi:hypothetical protein
MLAMLFIVIVTYLLKLANLEITIKMNDSIIIIGVLLISLAIVSYTTHRILLKSKEEKTDYLEVLDEPVVRVFGIMYSCVAVAMMCIMLACVNSETSMILPIIISLIIMTIMDVINTVIMFHSYIFDTKESIKDSLVRQMELAIYALFIMIGIVFMAKFTLIGGLIIIYIIVRIALNFRR